MRKKDKIRILHGLARCGGTVINRCLGSMQNTIVLSEINSSYSINPLLRQSDEWFGLISKWDKHLFRTISRLNGDSAFRMAVTTLSRRCRESGKCLVIRDWNHPDFVGYPFEMEPLGNSSTLQSLENDFLCISAAVVRHPIDQYLSSIKRKGLKDLRIETFLAGYRKFAVFASRRDYIKFEDFTREPAASLKTLCGALEITYDGKWVDNWHSYWKVTGDSDQPEQSRGANSERILPLKRGSISPELQQRFEANPDYHESLQVLGYT